MAPRKTATKRPQRTDGIKHVTDPKRHRSPWQLTIYHGGGKTRTYHTSEAAAEKAKKAADRLQKREGSRAFTYSREAQVEYEEAKKLIGDVRLGTIAQEYAVRLAAGAERKSVPAAVEHYIDTKIKLGRSYKHLENGGFRIGWRG